MQAIIEEVEEHLLTAHSAIACDVITREVVHSTVVELLYWERPDLLDLAELSDIKYHNSDYSHSSNSIMMQYEAIIRHRAVLKAVKATISEAILHVHQQQTSSSSGPVTVALGILEAVAPVANPVQPADVADSHDQIERPII